MMTKTDSLNYLETLNDKLKGIFTDLERYRFQELTTIPDGKTWSGIMNIDHLILTERVSLLYCKKKLSFNPKLNEFSEEDKKQEEKTAYLIRSPKYKVRAPAHLDESNLRNDIELPELLSEWHEVRRQIASFLSELDPKVFDKLLYKHPLAGRMRLHGMLLFFDAHMDSHTRQIKNNLALIGAD